MRRRRPRPADSGHARDSDGTYECYDIGHNTILLDGPLGQIDPALQVAGVGGFNGADTADLLMRDPTTGVFTLYDVSNNNITGNVALGRSVRNGRCRGLAISPAMPARPTC